MLINQKIVENKLKEITLKIESKFKRIVSRIDSEIKEDKVFVLVNLIIGQSLDKAQVNAEIENIKLEIIEDLEFAKAYKVEVAFTSPKENNKKLQQDKSEELKRVASKVVLVSSGKGGVGKSTMASAIAQELAAKGFKVGIVDADIYGPSISKIFGLELDKTKIIYEKFGVKVASIGSLIEEGQPVLWRGPMVAKALNFMLLSGEWGSLDYMIIDMPPGTGDIHLTLLKSFAIDGAIIVTTPQELAMIEANKTIEMYSMFNIEVLGIIKNMAFYEVEGQKFYPFGKAEGNVLNVFSKYRKNIIEVEIKNEISAACDNSISLKDTFNVSNLLELLKFSS